MFQFCYFVISGSLFGKDNVDLKIGGFFNSQQKSDSEVKRELEKLGEKLEKQTDKIQQLEMAINEKGFNVPVKSTDEETVIAKEPENILTQRKKSVSFNLPITLSPEIDLNTEKNFNKETYWIEDIREKFKDERLGEGKVRQIGDKEKDFWRKMIDKYLLPLEQTKVV